MSTVWLGSSGVMASWPLDHKSLLDHLEFLFWPLFRDILEDPGYSDCSGSDSVLGEDSQADVERDVVHRAGCLRTNFYPPVFSWLRLVVPWFLPPSTGSPGE